MRTAGIVTWALVRGLLVIGVVQAASAGLVALNARSTPDLIWFPLPVAVVLVAAAWWAERRWRIGFASPLRIPLGQAILLSVAVLVVGDAACVLQGAFEGWVRDRENVSYAVGPAFQGIYFLTLAALSAGVAEVAFRGIMQTRLHQLFGPGLVIVMLAAINVVSHRWTDEITNQWLGLFLSLAALGFLRWHTGSLWPPFLVHFIDNVLMALSLWRWGPLDHAGLSGAELVVTGTLGLTGLGVILYLAWFGAGARRAA